MAYHHYHGAPGWGTNQFSFAPPPRPGFVPSPSWHGEDYYRAHAINPDLELYGHAWNRVRDYSYGNGPGLHEARHWHRRAYGGLGDLSQMMPEEIGRAAAYEAYRTWRHHRSLYDPLGGDSEREREGLIAHAVAEATSLLQYTGRPMEPYSRTEASEAAAITASEIFYQTLNDDYRVGRPRSRSFSAYGSPYSVAGSIDPYAGDDFGLPYGAGAGHVPGYGMGMGSAYPTPYANAMTIPGAYGGYGYGQTYGYPGAYGSYPGVYPGGYSYAGAGMMPGGSVMVHRKPRHRSRHSSHRSRSRSRSVVMAPGYY